ncbi:DUF6351 family protein [Delftia acidovorans]|uniref:DUF6351 family protein n=1 Tax=Delftia acidovorans TaxID=80866 RepID=UPI003D14A456
MKQPTPFSGMVAAATLASVLTACGGSGDSGLGVIEIRSLSNRADMISDGNAYIEIVLPKGSPPGALKVALNGTDVTARFALRANGRILGRVEGLKAGANTLTATAAGSARARLDITNHGRGDPIFAGPQTAPWICATRNGAQATVSVPGTALSATVTTRVSGLDTDPVDVQCNTRTQYTYYYMPKARQGSACTMGPAGATPCHVAYDPSQRPADSEIADFTNDRGDTVKHLLRMETGVMGRGTFQILAYHDPAQAWTPWEPQKGWNGKVLWRFGAAASGNRFQEPAVNLLDQFSGSLPFDPNALAAGHMVVKAMLTNHLHNNNELLAAENMMRIKEHLIENYGEVRYTMGDGDSGGSMMQTVIASAMPGLLQGIQTGLSYPDAVSTWMETRDCGLLSSYYRTAAGQALSDTAKAAINGHPASYCDKWVGSFIAPQNPRLPDNCGVGFPASIVYDPRTRGQGVRCSIHDMLVPVFGTFKDTDGHTKPQLPYDNTGLQYGLKALQSGAIDAEAFVQLNEGIGSYTNDMDWTGGTASRPAARERAVASLLPRLYSSGLTSNGRNLSQVAIIDLRPEGGSDIHMTWRSLQQRARLDAANGHHDNHVIRASKGMVPLLIAPAMRREAFVMMDRWLTAVERDTTGAALAQKVVRNRPSDVRDGCIAATGAAPSDLDKVLALDDPACPLKPTLSPRQVAGGPLAEDIYQCQLKPLSFTSPEYAGITFSPAQQKRLAAVFAAGVCDWSQAGTGQSQEAAFLTDFSAGPAGTKAGPAPVSRND